MSKDKTLNVRVGQDLIEEIEKATEKINKMYSIGGLNIKNLNKSEVIILLLKIGVANLDKQKR
jgi:hypothetical protein